MDEKEKPIEDDENLHTEETIKACGILGVTQASGKVSAADLERIQNVMSVALAQKRYDVINFFQKNQGSDPVLITDILLCGESLTDQKTFRGFALLGLQARTSFFTFLGKMDAKKRKVLILSLQQDSNLSYFAYFLHDLQEPDKSNFIRLLGLLPVEQWSELAAELSILEDEKVSE
jgi:hypothetical protein